MGIMIKVETICFSVIEWNVVRISASILFPETHAAAAGWKHRALAFVEREG